MITTLNLNDSNNNKIEKIVYEYKQKNSRRLSKSAFINLALRMLIEELEENDDERLNELLDIYN